MFKSSAVSVAALAIMIVAAGNVDAQAVSSDHKARWEFIVNSGTVVPTGDQRNAIERGSLTAAQLSYVIRPSFAITASFGWARTRDVANLEDEKLDMLTYDVGGEVRANRWIADKTFSFSPFAGAGAGGRSYNYRSRNIDATHNLAAYGSAGAEIGVGRRVKVRMEARDYVTSFKSLVGEGSAVGRNDVALMAGLRLKVR
jgi:hypothetical protein